MIKFKDITSSDNPDFKQLKKIATNARERKKCRQTVLDGTHLLQSLAEAGLNPQLMVVCEGKEDSDEIRNLLKQQENTKVIRLKSTLFKAISPVDSPSGICAIIDIPTPHKTNHVSAVLLEKIQDPGNLGSILRTAAAAGIEAVYLSKGSVEAWSPKVLRAGMGAHFNIDILEQQELGSVAEKFKSVIATQLTATDSLYDQDLTDSVAFLLGNEGAGLSKTLADCATHNVIIPMIGKTESLNVAAAAAICLFERVRQLELKRK